MRVRNIDSKKIDVPQINKEKTSKVQDFSNALDLANKEQTEGRLQQMLKEIDILGKRLVSTRSLEDAKRYKQKIQEYLSFVIKNAYVLKKEPGPFNYGIHTKIEVINKKIDELTRELLETHKESLNLADSIEEIKGLLVDVYK